MTLQEGLVIETTTSLRVSHSIIGRNTDKYDIELHDTQNGKTIGYFCIKYTPGENTLYITEITTVAQYKKLTDENKKKYHHTWSIEELLDESNTSCYKGVGGALMRQVIEWAYTYIKNAEYIGIYCIPGREDRVGKLLETVNSSTVGIIKDIYGGSNDRAWDVQLNR